MNILFLLHPKADTIYIQSSNTIRQCLERMKAHGYNTLPVINDDGSFYGVISQGDLLWHIVDENSFEIKEQEHLNVSDIACKNKYVALKVDCELDDVVNLLLDQNFVPIVDDRNFYVGIITRKDIINYLYKSSDSYNMSKYLYK